MAFGPDGLLYVVGVPGIGAGFRVDALDATGAVQRTYTGRDYYAGNLTFGNVAVDERYVYTTGQNYLSRFDRQDPAAPPLVIYEANQVFDVEVLPSGNLLVGSAYSVEEITPDGRYVRNIPFIDFTDVRSVEYDPATNAVFVSHLGHTGTSARLYKFDYTTRQLVDSSSDIAQDMFVTSRGQLLISGPRLLNMNLDPLATFGRENRLFVTQYVPEPGICGSSVCVAFLLLARRRRATGC